MQLEWRATKLVGGYGPRVVISWLLIGVPLVYGVFQAVESSVRLFTGY